ncbi:hypothetical protein PISL3812_04078 [Talaromyces islandicus]|uniref:Uncharacterized protein n=1 Tax=Talaromyces islandicus TaxID=28573 RepID=A0A0U1LUH9_TALIS|nr:hypothetical protein PISL3812_04078 [Talaromyces islandicus]
MKIQFLATNDSDDDSWLEVLEGSPGPSLRASSNFESINSTEKALFERYVTDGTSESDEIQYLEDTVDESDAESKSNSQQSLSRYRLTEANASSKIDIRLPESIPLPSLLDGHLRLDRPEIGDIIRHFHDVYGICLTRADEAAYYQSCLCWMYRMAWNQIWVLVSRAPDCVVHAVNHLFGLRNHPFWSDRKGWGNEWHAMHAACSDILTWWNENRLSGEQHQTARDHSAVNTKAFSDAAYSEIEMYYGLSRLEEEQIDEQPTSDQGKTIITADQFVRVKRRIAAYEKMQKELAEDSNGFNDIDGPFSSSRNTMQFATSTEENKSSVPLEQNGASCAPPWPPQQVINYVTDKYYRFDKRSYKELSSYEIPFETWIHWNNHVHESCI